MAGWGSSTGRRNVALNRIYALKVLAPGLAEDEQFRQRFKREMRIAASLHHPNIVGIHYAGEHDGMLFFVMDYVTGTDLREILIKQGAIEPDPGGRPARAVRLRARRRAPPRPRPSRRQAGEHPDHGARTARSTPT